jgi:threonyl-tRNA synthetase
MLKKNFNDIYRHSMAHILAKAVIELYSEQERPVQYAIGPAISDGFYYDFDLPKNLSKDDFPDIEKKMKEILKRKEDWTRKEVSKDEALALFKGQRFKTELIEDLPEGETISIYYTGDDFVDLCRGPHVENSQELLGVSFKIKSVSGSYWRGDENRDQLQRIYVYAFPDKNSLKEHLAFVKEAQERDHKKLGPQLDLFMIHHTAPGMPYWLPKGWQVFNSLLEFWRAIHHKHGYQEISAPIVNSSELWEISGHWGHYQENMFIIPPIAEGDKTFALKPMNCPNAILTYKRDLHSYRDLPVRFSQVDVIHRKEKSGELNGLFRVQMFRQDDAHIILTEDQVAEEIKDIMDIATEIYGTFGLSYRAELSTRPDNYMGDLEVWDKAEGDLKSILDDVYGEGNYEINEGDGAFYGPKIDLLMTDAIGREWQMGTIQLDFQLPLNFDLKYTDHDGKQKRPVMIHRAILGSFERFIGLLIENFKGAFPFWLAPCQVGIVPIRPEHNDYAKRVASLLEANNIRFEADYENTNMREKIKKYKNYKIPYILVLGDREAEEETVSLNIRENNKQVNGIALDAFLDMCDTMNEEHSNDLLQHAPDNDR